MSRESDIEQEQWFHEDERRRARLQRKLLQRTDRSKEKQSDCEALEKKAQRRETTSLRAGRIVEIRAGDLSIFCTRSPNPEEIGTLVDCHIKGSFKAQRQKSHNIVAVGDRVEYLYDSIHARGQVTFVEPRSSLLSRGDNLNHIKEQILATNIDLLVITFPLFQPVVRPALIDRFLIAAQKGGLKPLLLVTKTDLFESQLLSLAVKEQEREKLKFIQSSYSWLEIFLWNQNSSEATQILAKRLAEETCVFSGPSGAGKSTIVSQLTGAKQRTLPVAQRTGLGSHATSHAKMISFEQGGWCIDTPGIRSLALWKVDRESVDSHFQEIGQEGAFCQFRDCKHKEEPNCSVKKAVEKGSISSGRYRSYLNVIEELEQEHLRR